MITVIGKLPNTEQYIDREGFNVLARRDDWTPAMNRDFIRQAIERGDHLLFVSWQATGQYREELIQILDSLLMEIT